MVATYVSWLCKSHSLTIGREPGRDCGWEWSSPRWVVGGNAAQVVIERVQSWNPVWCLCAVTQSEVHGLSCFHFHEDYSESSSVSIPFHHCGRDPRQIQSCRTLNRESHTTWSWRWNYRKKSAGFICNSILSISRYSRNLLQMIVASHLVLCTHILLFQRSKMYDIWCACLESVSLPVTDVVKDLVSLNGPTPATVCAATVTE